MKKVAIITGGSRGIGAAIALKLADDHAICINYHSSKEKADELVEQITSKGGTAIAVAADVKSEEQLINLFNAVDTLLGPVTTLINNAGITGHIAELIDYTQEHVQTIFSTNVFSIIIACREAIKRMKQNKFGNIINITSEAAKFGGNRIAAYAASKAAVNTLTVSLAREVAKDNIRVNAISPGVIDTEMHQQATPDRLQQLINTIPLGRMGRANEVAETVRWLVSEYASYITGTIIPITGGR